jgi:hypothetical protein
VLAQFHVLRLGLAPTGGQHSWHTVDTVLIQSRWIIGYEFYVIAGLVAAAHADELHRFVDRHMRSILTTVVAIGVLTEGYYLITEAAIHNPAALRISINRLPSCGSARPSSALSPSADCGLAARSRSGRP